MGTPFIIEMRSIFSEQHYFFVTNLKIPLVAFKTFTEDYNYLYLSLSSLSVCVIVFVMPFHSREIMGVIILLKVVQTTILASTSLNNKLRRIIMTGVHISQQTLNICIIFIDFRCVFTWHFSLCIFYHMTFKCFILIDWYSGKIIF